MVEKVIACTVYIQYRHVTDGQTDTARRQRPRYAERRAGKNEVNVCTRGA